MYMYTCVQMCAHMHPWKAGSVPKIKDCQGEVEVVDSLMQTSHVGENMPAAQLPTEHAYKVMGPPPKGSPDEQKNSLGQA